MTISNELKDRKEQREKGKFPLSNDVDDKNIKDQKGGKIDEERKSEKFELYDYLMPYLSEDEKIELEFLTPEEKSTAFNKIVMKKLFNLYKICSEQMEQEKKYKKNIKENDEEIQYLKNEITENLEQLNNTKKENETLYLNLEEKNKNLEKKSMEIENILGNFEKRNITIKNNGENVITSNHGIKKITIKTDVKPKLQEKVITIDKKNKDKTTIIEPNEEYYGLKKVIVKTDIEPELQRKVITIKKEGTITIKPDFMYDGLKEIVITTEISNKINKSYVILIIVFFLIILIISHL